MANYSSIPLSDSTRARYTRDARRLHTILHRPEENFDLAYFRDSQNIPAIREALDALDVGTARKMEYVRTLCSILGALKEPHRELLDLLKEYRSGERRETRGSSEKDTDADKSLLQSIMQDYNTDKAVRALCTLLYYGIKTDISSVIKARLDAEEGCIRTDKKSINIPEECAERLREILPLNSETVSRVSRLFKERTGQNYSQFKVKLGEDTTPLEDETKIPSTSHNCQDTACHYYDWTAIDIVLAHKDNIRYLCGRLGTCHCSYNWTYFNKAETLQKIKELENISDNTRINYLTALCVVMEETAGSMYSEYAIYRQELILAMSKQNLTRQVPWFPDIYGHVASLTKDKSVNRSIRVLALLITDNACIDSEGRLVVADCRTETGILRPSDLVNTVFCQDDGVQSFLSLDEGYWLIREECTKNKVERRLELSASLVAGIREIYGDEAPKFLIVAKDGERYRGAISSMFEEYIGHGFDEVRASYFTWRESITPPERRGELLELCRRQGHQYSTAMMNYRRIPKREE